MAARSKENPSGIEDTPILPSARRLWGRVLVGKPIPIPDTDLAVRYDLDRVMGLAQHRPKYLATQIATQRKTIAERRAREVAFTAEWGTYEAAPPALPAKFTAETQATYQAAQAAYQALHADEDLRLAHETATEANRQANQAFNETIAAQNREIALITLADIVVAIGVPHTGEKGESLDWDADAEANYGPRPDPHCPESWAEVPDLILDWIINAGVTLAEAQVDSFRYGRP